ncbi:hypothetical protein Q8791_29070 [Nocardiopsis sp. CT-R113]|uniref:Tape measure protein n=1 Tax=Nocardiopsis codii TaxID=3065942 RepID=A0ABU7KGC0_9ACTN|nr:hypothetical protein [Nocardiopsis sp. CT-R113]MEE2041284.1 hypothetical protein [Nocardiopsis sp. CT-R113]
MALKVGELVAYLRGDDSHLQRALKRTEQGLASVGRSAAFATLAASAVSLAAAIGPASGAVLALPPALLVAGAAAATLAVGLSGMGDALAATGGTAEELEEALDGLSPSAQSFVRSFAGFRSAFAPVRDAVQERLFAGLGSEVDRLALSSIPTLRTGMVGLSGALNTAAKSATSTMSSDVFNGTLSEVFAGTTRVTERFGQALGPLLQVLASLAVAGLPLVERFTEWAAGGIESAAAFLTTEAGAARLAGMVERAGDVLSQLGTIGSNLTTALGGMFGPAGASGAGLLDTIEALTERFATWAQSAEGQAGLSTLFDTLGAAAQNVLALLPLLTGTLGAVVSVLGMLPPGAQAGAAGFLAFAMVGGGLISRLGALTGTVKGVAGAIGSTASGISRFASGFRSADAAAGAASGKLGTVGGAVRKVGSALGSGIGTSAKFAASMVGLGAKALVMGAKMLAGWLMGLGPIGLIVAAVIAVVALVVIYWDQIVAAVTAGWEWVKQATAAAWEWVKSALGAALDFIVGLFMKWHPVGIIISHWDQIKAATAAAWDAVKAWIAAAWAAIVAVVTNHINRVKAFITAGWNAVKAANAAVWNGIKSVISAVWAAIVAVVSSVIGRVRSTVTGAWNTIKSATSSAWNSIRSSITNTINRAWSTVKGIVSRFTGIGRDIVNGIINGVTGAASRLYGKLRDMATGALDAAKNALGINSPSRVFANEIGRWIPPGVSAGIASAQTALDRDLAAMVAVPPPPPGWDGAAAGASGLGDGPRGPAVHIENWNATERVSAHELGETLHGLVSARG